MKSILITKPGSFDIAEIEKPIPLEDEILVEMKAVALCNQHDWKVNKGLYHDLKYVEYGVPGFPGHEGAGVVVESGTKATSFEIGDHVVLSGLGGQPLYSQFVTRKANLVARADKRIPLDQLAMSELLGCVHRAVKNVNDYKGKTVAVSGCGPGGLAAVQIVKAYGASFVTALDVREERLRLAAELGADSIVNVGKEAHVDELKKNGVDVVIECSGNKFAYQNAVYMAREGVVVFAYSEGNIELPLYPMFDHELTIYNSKWLTNDDLQAVVDMISAGKINTEKMISRKIGFEQYLEAVEQIGRGEVIKVVMNPWEDA